MIAAGPEALRERVAPVLDAIGVRTVWTGQDPAAGSATRLKLVVNSWVIAASNAAGEILALADVLGEVRDLGADRLGVGGHCDRAQRRAPEAERHARGDVHQRDAEGVARDIVRWLDAWLSDRTEGGFYASQDADINLDDDGDYFTWTLDEARAKARDAAALVDVVYEPLVPVLSPDDALAPGAPQVNPKHANLLSRTVIRRGDARKARAGSAHPRGGARHLRRDEHVLVARQYERQIIVASYRIAQAARI